MINRIILLLLLAPCFAGAQTWSVQSPHKTLTATIRLNSSGAMYTVADAEGQTVIDSSPLGVETNHGSYTTGLSVAGSQRRAVKDQYSMLIGKRKFNTATANEMTISLRNANNEPLEIIFRAYDNGVAFRYHFTGSKKPLTIITDNSGFKIPTEGKAWLQDYGLPADWAPAYEGWYTNGSPIGANARDSSGWSFPALFHSRDNWILLSESALDENYFGGHLRADCRDGLYQVANPQAGEARGHYPATATASGPFYSPWRVIISGKKLATILESNLVYDLAAPSKLSDVSWIKPGRSSWSWWSNHKSSQDYAALASFVDLSAEMGWEYSLVDANWNKMQNGGSIEDLLKHAKGKQVGLTLWYNSGGLQNQVTEQPRDILSDPIKRKAEFKKLHDWGVHAVKIDFFNSDKQEIIREYVSIFKDAAAEHLMVVTHGCTVPRGWPRTYPNLVSMEAIKGAEQYGWDTLFARTAASHNIIELCTRNVVGPADYTPVTFTDYSQRTAHTTTNAYELASAVLFESGILHFADRREAYEELPDQVKQYLRTIPVTWDDTRFIDGEPGSALVLARKKGNDWYIAGANGEDSSKSINLNMPFLGSGTYNAVLFRRGANDRTIEAEQIAVSRDKSLTIPLSAKDGFTLWIKKKQ